MWFGTKFSGALVALLAGCSAEPPSNAGEEQPPLLPDTQLPNDDDSWKWLWRGDAFRDGVSTASEPLAAQAAAEVMAAGGNAIDAAVTAMFMLNVVEPHSSGIGGGGFVMLHMADSNETLTLNCRETAPAATTPDMFVSQPDFSLRSSSGYSVGVPGMVLCAATLLENWGTISLAESLQPAIDAARNGIVVSSRLASNIQMAKLGNERAPEGNPMKPAYDVARAVFQPSGVPLRAGDLLVQPDLAHTFELIAEFGPDAFYRCDHEAGIAQAIVDAQLVTRVANPDGMGRMTCADLAAYGVEILAPLSRSYREYEILSMPPPSGGGIAVLQILGMLERFPIGDKAAGFGFGDFATLNVMLEATRLAFADRSVWVGDGKCPSCTNIPVTGLLSDAYLVERAELIEPGKRLTGIPAGTSDAVDFSDSTTHVAIIDGGGNIVNFTGSIEANWGTGIMVPLYGFLLNNQLTDFNPVPTYNPDPLAFDPGANDAAPGKQPLSSIAPTIVLLDGKPVAAYGSPAGAFIINAVVDVSLNLIDHHMTLQQAVRAPRIAMTSASDMGVGQREAGFSLEAILALQALGYSLSLMPSIGAIQAVVTIPEMDAQYGVADDRRIGGVYAADWYE